MSSHALTDPTPVVELDEVDSTNLEALRRAGAGARGPIWIIADRQTAGRGRSGRAWISAPGNLAATLLFAPGCAATELHQLSLLAGVAVHDMLAQLRTTARHDTGAALRLKWPNDILVGDAKLGGILIESIIVQGTALAAIGIGVNIASSPAIHGRAIAATAQWGSTPTPRAMLDALDAQMRHWLGIWRAGAGFAEIIRGWETRAGAIGEPIEVNTGTEVLCGAFAGIDETGALLVDSVPTNQGKMLLRFTFGDVSLLAREDEGSK